MDLFNRGPPYDEGMPTASRQSRKNGSRDSKELSVCSQGTNMFPTHRFNQASYISHPEAVDVGEVFDSQYHFARYRSWNQPADTDPLIITEREAIALLGHELAREIGIDQVQEDKWSIDTDGYTMNNREFMPTARIIGLTREPLSAEMYRKAVEAGLDMENTAYQGTVTKFDIENAATKPEESCALYLTNIHPQVMHDLTLLFGKIKTGKVFSFHLSPPEKKKGISTCAAFLTFMNRKAAENFLNTCCSRSGIYIGDCRLKAIWNRKRIGPSKKPHQSRVLEFRGPPNELSLDSLNDLFKRYLYYDLVTASDTILNDCQRVVIMEFASVRAQAESAHICFGVHFKNDVRFSVSWGQDPCEQV